MAQVSSSSMHTSQVARDFSPFGQVLPMSVWEWELWPRLDAGSRGALRLCCKDALATCNQLVNALHLRGPTAAATAEKNTSTTNAAAAEAAASFARSLGALRSLTLSAADGAPLEPWLDGPLTSGPPLTTVHTLRLVSAAQPCTIPPEHALSGADPQAPACDLIRGPSLDRLVTALPGLHRAAVALHTLPPGIGAALACRCPELQEVSLTQHCSADPDQLVEALVALAAAPKLASLEYHLKGPWRCGARQVWHLGTARECLAAPARLAGLRRLSFNAPWTWEALAPLSALTGLTSLAVCYPQASDALRQALPLHGELRASIGRLSGLAELHMPGTSLTPDVWTELLVGLPRLAVATFKKAALLPAATAASAAASAAAQLPPAPHVRRLVLCWESHLSDLLAALGALPKLQVFGCKVMTWPLPAGLACWARLRELDRLVSERCAADADAVSVRLRVLLLDEWPGGGAALAAALGGGPAFARVACCGLHLQLSLDVGPEAARAMCAHLLLRAFPGAEKVKIINADLSGFAGSPASPGAPTAHAAGCETAAEAQGQGQQQHQQQRPAAGAVGAAEAGAGSVCDPWVSLLAVGRRRGITLDNCRGLDVASVHALAVRLAQSRMQRTRAVCDAAVVHCTVHVQHCDGMGAAAAQELAQLAHAHPGVVVQVVH